MRVIENVDHSLWLEIAKACPYATFYHTPSWAKLMAETFSYVDMAKGFVFDDGTKVIFPFMKRKRKGFYDYVSGPPYTYGGPIAGREISSDQAREMMEYITSICTCYCNIIIRGNPYTNAFAVEGFQPVADLAHIIDLSGFKNEEELIKSAAYVHRHRVRIGQRSNLIIKKADAPHEYEVLFGIYLRLIGSWGGVKGTQYRKSYFRAMFGMDDPGRNFWVVYRDGTMIGGEVSFTFNHTCCCVMSYFDKAYADFQPRRYLLHHVYLDCMKNGVRYYDFMQSAGKKGLEQFKSSAGGRVHNYTAWLKENKYCCRVSRLKQKIIRLFCHGGGDK